MKYGWSLDESVWSRLAQVLSKVASKLQWVQAPLDNFHKLSIPKEPGIYMLCSPPLHCEKYFNLKQVPMFNALYIGSTEDLNSRFTDYAKQKNLSSDKVEYFLENYAAITFICAVCDISEFEAVEGALIDSFGPSANGQRAGVGAPIPGTIGQGRRP